MDRPKCEQGQSDAIDRAPQGAMFDRIEERGLEAGSAGLGAELANEKPRRYYSTRLLARLSP
jgi:hypothetical protein